MVSVIGSAWQGIPTPPSLRWRKGVFTNWELSANRANASRRELVVGGMDDTKVLRVVGLASTVRSTRTIRSIRSIVESASSSSTRKTELAILQEEGPESEVGGEEIMPDGLKLPGVGKGTAG
jgi:chemotaxis protein MotB